MSGARTTSLPESVTDERNFLAIVAGSSSTSTVPCSLPPVVDILRSGNCRSMIRAADLGDPDLGDDQRLPEAGVEALGDVAHQLDVLALILADRDLVGAVGEHVCGLQHRVDVQAGRDELALGR